jgi:TatD DNase family protein
MLTAWVSGARLEIGAAPGVLHSYTGPIEVARAALGLGFYLGVNGIATFPSARDVQAVVAEAPLERLLV